MLHTMVFRSKLKIHSNYVTGKVRARADRRPGDSRVGKQLKSTLSTTPAPVQAPLATYLKQGTHRK